MANSISLAKLQARFAKDKKAMKNIFMEITKQPIKKIAVVTEIANAVIMINLLTKQVATNAEHMKVCMKQAAQWAEEKKWSMK